MTIVRFGDKVIDFMRPQKAVVYEDLHEIYEVTIAMPLGTDDVVPVLRDVATRGRDGVRFSVELPGEVTVSFVQPLAVAGPVIVTERGINGAPDLVCHTYILEIKEGVIDASEFDQAGAA